MSNKQLIIDTFKKHNIKFNEKENNVNDCFCKIVDAVEEIVKINVDDVITIEEVNASFDKIYKDLQKEGYDYIHNKHFKSFDTLENLEYNNKIIRALNKRNAPGMKAFIEYPKEIVN